MIRKTNPKLEKFTFSMSSLDEAIWILYNAKVRKMTNHYAKKCQFLSNVVRLTVHCYSGLQNQTQKLTMTLLLVLHSTCSATSPVSAKKSSHRQFGIVPSWKKTSPWVYTQIIWGLYEFTMEKRKTLLLYLHNNINKQRGKFHKHDEDSITRESINSII